MLIADSKSAQSSDLNEIVIHSCQSNPDLPQTNENDNEENGRLTVKEDEFLRRKSDSNAETDQVSEFLIQKVHYLRISSRHFKGFFLLQNITCYFLLFQIANNSNNKKKKMDKGRIPLNRGKSVSFLDVTSSQKNSLLLQASKDEKVSRSAENNSSFNWTSNNQVLVEKDEDEEEEDEEENAQNDEDTKSHIKEEEEVRIEPNKKRRNNVYQRSRSAVSLLISKRNEYS